MSILFTPTTFTPLTPFVIAALAASVESITRLRERQHPPGVLIAPRKDGRRVHVIYHAPPNLHDAPCVVFEAGANSWSPVWNDVASEVGQVARVFRYDRPGYGFSDPIATPDRPIASAAEDLLSSLVAIGARPPYVLVAHSLGALYINELARQLRPADVTGIVYVDAASLETVRMLERVVPKSTSPLWFARIVSSLGLLRFLSPIVLKQYAEQFQGSLRKEVVATWAKASWLMSYTGEWTAAVRESKGSRAITTYTPGWLGSIPIAVLVPDVYERTEGRGYVAELQQAVARYSTDALVFPVGDCGHFVQLERPDAVFAAIRNVMKRAEKNGMVSEIEAIE